MRNIYACIKPFYLSLENFHIMFQCSWLSWIMKILTCKISWSVQISWARFSLYFHQKVMAQTWRTNAQHRQHAFVVKHMNIFHQIWIDRFFYCCNSEEFCNLTKKRATTKSNLIAQKRQSQINCTKFRKILIILQVKIGFTKLRCIITSMGMQ